MKTRLKTFDQTDASVCELLRPEKYEDIFRLPTGPIIARGAGLSYCNATAFDKGTSVDMSSFNRILSFDDENGIIKVEAGITIGDLNNFVIPRGWQLPVLPGYPLITVGGCIGFNVHGKSQFKIGLFGDWVNELTIFHPVHGEIICSKLKNSSVLDLTIGGMGFTGIILSATMRLKKIQGDRLSTTIKKINNIHEAVALMTERNEDYDYVYSWNNFNLKGNSFGKGFVFLEKIEPGFVDKKKKIKFRNRLLPHKNWPVVYNKFTIFWMCQVYYWSNLLKSAKNIQSLSASSFPIYGKEIYYYMFGRKGFREYQVIFPHVSWNDALEEIRQLIDKTRMPVALASLKIFRGSTHNISFSGEGICLAMDIPNNRGSVSFFEKLDEIAVKYKAIINLSKDSRVSASTTEQLFEQYREFKTRLNDFDPGKLFMSSLRKRLQL